MLKPFTIFVVASIASVAASVPSIAQDAIVIAGYGGSTEKLLRDKIIAPFEQAHRVRVTYVAGNSTDNLAKLQAAKDNQEIDVVMIDDGPMMRAVSLGFCAQHQGVDLDRLHDVAKLPGDKALGLGILATGLMYNTKVFRENNWPAPTSWNDLTDPKFKGKSVMPPLSNGYGLLTVVMLARMNGGGEKNIDPGFKVMKESVAANMLAFEASPAKHAELFQTGQAIFGVWGTARVQVLADAGVPVEFVYPKEGSPVIMTAICPAAKRTVSPKAHAFVQMMLSPATQALLADEGGFAPVHKDAKVQKPGMMPIGALASRLVAVDWDTINPVRDDWNRRWVREIER